MPTPSQVRDRQNQRDARQHRESACRQATSQATRVCTRAFNNSLASNAYSPSGIHAGIRNIIQGNQCRQAVNRANAACKTR